MTVPSEIALLFSSEGAGNGPLYLSWPKDLRGNRCLHRWGLAPRHIDALARRNISQAPSSRSISRLMIWRWISDVPSQIRSTRASRQNRSNG